MCDRRLTEPVIIIDTNSISLLSIKNGDTVIVRVPEGIDLGSIYGQLLANQMLGILHYRQLDKCSVIVTRDDVSVETFDEDVMASRGWVRVDREW